MTNEMCGLVTAMTGRTGCPVANQYIVRYPDGTTYFQSYQTIVCKVEPGGEILINRNAYLSRTTKKYLAQFLGVDAKQLNYLLPNLKKI